MGKIVKKKKKSHDRMTMTSATQPCDRDFQYKNVHVTYCRITGHVEKVGKKKMKKEQTTSTP